MTELAPSERLIVALDYNNAQDALNLVDELEDVVSFYKVGLELFVSEGWGVVKDLLKRKKRVFLDLKIDDIEETISRTVKQVAHMGVDFLTIHGNHATARAAHAAKGSHLKILQITLLTSVNEQDLRDLMLVGDGKRFSSKDEYVLWRAEVSMNCGCDGVIASGQDARMLRQKLGSEALLVCPGIRPAGKGLADHKRPSTPSAAIKDGADYLVVGRPIRDSNVRAEAARAIVEEIQRGILERDGGSLSL